MRIVKCNFFQDKEIEYYKFFAQNYFVLLLQYDYIFKCSFSLDIAEVICFYIISAQYVQKNSINS